MRDIGFRPERGERRAGSGAAASAAAGRARRDAGLRPFRRAGRAEARLADSLRLDKFLWFARIVKTRALAQELAEEGRLRLNGRVVDRAHAPVRVGDVLSFAQRGAVRVLQGRGPARPPRPAGRGARSLLRIDERSRAQA